MTTPRRTRLRRALGLAAVFALAVTAGCSDDPGTPEPPPDAPSASAPSEGAEVSGETMTGFLNHNDTGSAGLPLEERSGGDFGERRMSFHTAESTSFDEYVQVEFPAGSASQSAVRSDDTNAGGAQSYWTLADGPLDDAYLRYWVWFPEGFDFVKGGKLPGLYGGRSTSGGNIPDGSDGFSTRYMWRENGAAEVYAYLPTSSEHGTSIGRGAWSWPTGRWSCIEQRVSLNTPGTQDGSVQVWLDGRPVLSTGGLEFRDTPDLRIDGLFFSTFFGGGDESWATPSDQIVRFAGFDIGTGRLGCG